MESESGKGSGFNRTALTTPKIAVFAPIPMVSTASAERVKPGFLRSTRIACVAESRRSRIAPTSARSAPAVNTYYSGTYIFFPTRPVFGLGTPLFEVGQVGRQRQTALA